MKNFIILYKETSSLFTDPIGFSCEAETLDLAEEKFYSKYPKKEILWCFEGTSTEMAIDNYYEI